jgi:hypothetical protein
MKEARGSSKIIEKLEKHNRQSIGAYTEEKTWVLVVIAR